MQPASLASMKLHPRLPPIQVNRKTHSLATPSDYGGRKHVAILENHPIFMTVASAQYIDSLTLLVKSLEAQGIRRTNTLTACVDTDCVEHCESKGFPVLQVTGEVRARCQLKDVKITKMRCIVSMMKAVAIKDILSSGRPVYFVDADVYFYTHPMSGVPRSMAGVDIIVQPNGVRLHWPLRGTDWNFGAFLVMPTPASAKLFSDIEDDFNRTLTWDQKLFNKYIHHASGPQVAALSLEMYPSYMLSPSGPPAGASKSMGSLVGVHATCIEGSLTKLLAVESLWGSLPCRIGDTARTVTWGADLDASTSSVQDLENAIRPLVAVAMKTGRDIRVRASKPWRLFSADFLGSLGVRLVPADFWDGMRVVPMVANATSVASAVDSTADEVQLTGTLTGTLKSPADLPDHGRGFTCKSLRLPLKPAVCLRHCDGKHFRI